MIKTIIFDLGGVYLNRGLWEFWNYMEKEYKIPSEEIRKNFLTYYKQYFSGKISEEEFWKGHLTDLKINANYKDLRTKALNFFKPQEEMPELISKLRENYKVGLLSDQTKEWWPYLDEKHGISNNFDFTIISAETGYHKPQPEIYKIALEKSNSKSEESLFIDDLAQNLEPAKEMGMKTLFFENPNQVKRELKNLDILK